MLKNITPSLPEHGKIKAGMKEEEITISAKGVKYHRGVKLDHFLITKAERDEKGINFILDNDIMNSLKKDKSLLNAKKDLISIPIRLLYNDIDLNFHTRNACYVGGRCVCSGNGEKATTRDGREIKCPCNKIEPEYDGRDVCKVNGKLFAVIDGINVIGACHVLRTTSINTVRSILGGLAFIQASSGGLLAFLPLHLMLKPITVTPGGKSRIVYVSSIVFRGSIEDLQTKSLEMARSKAKYLIAMDSVEDKARRALESNTESLQEQKDVQDEFYPDAADGSNVQDAEVVEETETNKTELPKTDGLIIPRDNKSKLDLAKESIEKKEEKTDVADVADVADVDQTDNSTETDNNVDDIPFEPDETKEPEQVADVLMVEKSQKEQMVKLKKKHKIATGPAWEKLLKPFNVKTANDLTFDQAEKFIESLSTNPT